MSTGAHRLRVRPFKADLRAAAGVRSAGWLSALVGIVLGVALAPPAHFVDPGARAAIETMIALSAICSAALVMGSFRHSRRASDLLLMYALVAVALADFLYSAVPVLAGGVGVESDGAARLGSQLIVALAFAAAAFAPHKATLDARHRRTIVLLGTGAGAVALAGVLGQVTGSNWGVISLREVGMASAARHPVDLAVHLASAAAFIVSALAFLRRQGRGEIGCGLLAAASSLLAAARLQYLVMPAVATDWVTPREGLRLAAYALLLASAYRHYAATRRAQARAAVISDHERIARDLHDGLAQDLACIIAQGQRLGAELEPEHPIMIAARRALASSREVIADLSASGAPNTEAALRLVADELEHRFGLGVEVRIETAIAVGQELEPVEREHVVRIAREAIVNAALHGAAHHVDVLLRREGKDLLLRVCDDGCGIDDAPSLGLGLRTMRARAASLGGRLSAHRGAGGGTELELLIHNLTVERAPESRPAPAKVIRLKSG